MVSHAACMIWHSILCNHTGECEHAGHYICLLLYVEEMLDEGRHTSYTEMSMHYCFAGKVLCPTCNAKKFHTYLSSTISDIVHKGMLLKLLD